MIKIKNPLHKKIALFIDVCGSIFYRWGCLCHLWVRKDINLDDFIPRKILVVVIEPLGDVLMSTPVFRALKSKYPATYLSVLISSAGREIIANNPYIDEVITEDCPWLYSRPITLSGLLQQLKYFLFSYWKMYNKIKAAKYDLGIDLRGDFRHILFFLFLPKISCTVSYDRAGGGYLLSKTVMFEPEEHKVIKNMNLLKPLGLEKGRIAMSVYPREEDKLRVEDALQKKGIDKDDLIVIIHPGASRKVRLWSATKYSQLADAISHHYKSKIIFTGSTDDLLFVKRIVEQTRNSVTNLCGKLRLLELAVLLEKAVLLICPDTSIMHLAAAVSLPTIILFGPEEPQQVAPQGEDAYVVWKKIDCAPCPQIKCDSWSADDISACMDAICVEDIMDKVTLVLGGNGAKNICVKG